MAIGVCKRRSKQNRCTNLASQNLFGFPRLGHCIVMNGVCHLMAQCASELFPVPDEIHQCVRHVDIPAGYRKCVRSGFVDQEEPEGMFVSRLSDLRNQFGHGSQRVYKGDAAMISPLVFSSL